MHEHLLVEYSDYYVAFLDALGFSEKLKDSSKKNLKQISTYFTVVRKSLAELKSVESKSAITSFVISDSVIFAMPANAKNGDPIETLRELCVAVQKIQWGLAKYGIWFRGAITKGDCWVDQEAFQITGPAYIKAVTLEREAARYPRVILDPAIIPLLKKKNRAQFIESINQETSSVDKYSQGPVFDWQRTTRIDSNLEDDTLSFIDYIGPWILERDRNGQSILELKIIIDNIEQSLFEQKTYEKYRWLVNYLLVRIGSDSATGNGQHLSEIYEKLQSM